MYNGLTTNGTAFKRCYIGCRSILKGCPIQTHCLLNPLTTFVLAKELLWSPVIKWAWSVGGLSNEVVKISSGGTKAMRGNVTLDIQELTKHVLFLT